VVNDRWQTDLLFRRLMGLRPARGSFDLLLKRVTARDPGVGTSYGYNRQETDADYAPFEQTLFPDFVSAVAKNGRLLLHVGPAGGGGQIPPEQRSRLEAFGAWLDANGEAVTGTRPYHVAGATTADGLPVWFTQAPGRVNAVVVGRPTGATVRIRGVSCPRRAGACSATAAW
jgi:alpha-L-fucosidase